MRVKSTTFFEKAGIVEVRSRPLWVVILEFWFLWVHEFWTHVVKVRFPEDPYWGEPMEAAFHEFYTWSLGIETIDKSAKFTNLRNGPQGRGK